MPVFTQRASAICKGLAGPVRQLAFGTEAKKALTQVTQQTAAISKVCKPGHSAQPGRISWKPTDEPFTRGNPVAGMIVMQKLDFHFCHIHPRGTFAATPLATDAQLQGVEHLAGSEGFFSQLTRQGKTQAVGAASGEMLFLPGHPIRRAHHIGVPFTARAIVVAHLDSTRKTSPCRPVQSSIEVLGAIARLEPEKTPVIHPGGADDLARIKYPVRIKQTLDLGEGVHHLLAEHCFMKFGTDESVAMLSGV